MLLLQREEIAWELATLVSLKTNEDGNVSELTLNIARFPLLSLSMYTYIKKCKYADFVFQKQSSIF